MFCVWCVSDGWWLLLFFLEEQCSHAAHFALLLHKDFEVLVDDCDSQEDSCTRTDGTQEVSHDRQPSYTEATKGSSCGDVPANMKVNYKYIESQASCWILAVYGKLCSLYLLSSCTIEVSLCPLITICCSFSCFATWDTQSDIGKLISRGTVIRQVTNAHRNTDLHLWRRILRPQSRSWRRRHRSRAWRQCR